MKNQILLNKLKTGDKSSYELLYRFYFPLILSFVKKNNGNHEDAEDIFQEAIVVLLKKVKTEDFSLTASLKTYLYSIARNIWLKRLRDNKLVLMENNLLADNQSIEQFIENDSSKQEKLINWLEKITENCQRILKAIFFYKEPMENLMKKMGWKNKHTAANQQYKCIQQIKKQKNIEGNLP